MQNIATAATSLINIIELQTLGIIIWRNPSLKMEKETNTNYQLPIYIEVKTDVISI